MSQDNLNRTTINDVNRVPNLLNTSINDQPTRRGALNKTGKQLIRLIQFAVEVELPNSVDDLIESSPSRSKPRTRAGNNSPTRVRKVLN